MPALAERTKIKTEAGNIPSTTGFIFYGGSSDKFSLLSGDINIDANAHVFASGSIQIQTQSYIPELSTKAKEILHKLYKFKQLKTDWDGNGAITPKEDVINNAANFLTNSDEFDLPIYFTAPGPNGEIVLEYKKRDDTAEIFFEEDNISEMILYKGKKQVYAGKIQLKQLITHFMPTLILHGW
jgi:hypothetical protein